MPRYALLVRGVNVGGRAKLAMADLRAAVEAAGGSDVTTYVQSGNIICSHDARSAVAVSDAVHDALLETAGLDVPVIGRSSAAWRHVVTANPFPDIDDHTAVHVVFFPDRLDPATAAKLVDLDDGRFAPERVVVDTDRVHLHLPDGMGRSKLAVAVTRVAPAGTARNWRTVLAIAELLEG